MDWWLIGIIAFLVLMFIGVIWTRVWFEDGEGIDCLENPEEIIKGVK